MNEDPAVDDRMNNLQQISLDAVEISDCIKFWRNYNPFSQYLNNSSQTALQAVPSGQLLSLWGLAAEYVCIKRRWFKVLSESELFRARGSDDGKYHYIYIQINAETGEYYIGKSNKARWSEVKRYQGSGLRFKHEYAKHRECFVRYYLWVCRTAAETEELESELVDEDLLQDEKCLNLVAGGGGVPRSYSDDNVRREKLRAYNRAHPERYSAMLAKAAVLYHSGNTAALVVRGQRIKKTMSADKYRTQMSERIRKWRIEHPEEYAESRERNKRSLRKASTKAKRKASRIAWQSEHPDEYAEWQAKLRVARQTPEAKAKRKASLKKWKESHPEGTSEALRRMNDASKKKTSKAVCRVDLKTGEVLETYASQHDAARWLVSVGLAMNLNCVSSVSEVCRHARCTTGYGYRQKAYGFGWRFDEEPVTGITGPDAKTLETRLRKSAALTL